MVRVFIGGFIGAIIAFAWSFISWGVLPWHDMVMNKFSNQEFVSWVVKENAPTSGVYFAPFYKPKDEGLSPEEIKEHIVNQKEAMKKGPLVYAQVRLDGVDPSGFRIYLYSFLTQFIGAMLICWLLKQAIEMRYGGRLLFVTLTGLTIGVLGFIPDWTWFGAGWKFTLVMIADMTINWFLVGLFLAAYIKERKRPNKELMM